MQERQSKKYIAKDVRASWGKSLIIEKDLVGPVECMAGDGGGMQKGRDWGAFGGEGSTWRVKCLDYQIWGQKT